LPNDDVVVSRYISRPLLLDGYKFDLRLYVAVTSFEPLRLYVFDEGLARFSTEQYRHSESASSSLHNHFMHLTNYSINKHSAYFVSNHDAAADDYGNKWSLSALKRCLARNTVDVAALFARIDALIVKTIIGVQPSVVNASRRFCPHRGCCFELLGFDVIIDETLKPWLLEVNLSPSLAVDTPLDLKVKSRMLADLLTLVAFSPSDQRSYQRKQQRRRSLRLERLTRGQPSATMTCASASRVGSADAPGSQRASASIRQMDLEYQKRRGWRRVFPVADGGNYLPYFEPSRRHINALLVQELHSRRTRGDISEGGPSDRWRGSSEEIAISALPPFPPTESSAALSCEPTCTAFGSAATLPLAASSVAPSSRTRSGPPTCSAWPGVTDPMPASAAFAPSDAADIAPLERALEQLSVCEGRGQLSGALIRALRFDLLACENEAEAASLSAHDAQAALEALETYERTVSPRGPDEKEDTESRGGHKRAVCSAASSGDGSACSSCRWDPACERAAAESRR